MTREYPHLDEWFSDLTHDSAQISQTTGNRLLSAQEKLGLVGGAEQVKESLGKKVRERPIVILAACGIQPMAVPEVRKYASLLSAKPPKIGAVDMRLLVASGELDDTGNIVYISRLPQVSDRVAIADRIGYLTTDDGLAELSRRRTTERRRPRLLQRARPQGI